VIIPPPNERLSIEDEEKGYFLLNPVVFFANNLKKIPYANLVVEFILTSL